MRKACFLLHAFPLVSSLATFYGNDTSFTNHTTTSSRPITAFINTTTSADDPSLTSCISARSSWSAANSSWFQLPGHVHTYNVSTSISTSAQREQFLTDESNVTAGYPTAFATCNGIPYATDWWTPTIITAVPATSTVPFPTPAPSCTVDDDQCMAWYLTNNVCAGITSYPNTGIKTAPSWCALYQTYAPCPSPTQFSAPWTSLPNEPQCQIEAGMVKLHYWPRTLVAGSGCNQTLTSGPTNTTRVAVIGTATITSPDVAISIPWIYARNVESQRWGRYLQDVVVTLPPDDIRSLQAFIGAPVYGTRTGTSFNFDDLLPGYPSWGEWLGQYDCGNAWGAGTTGEGASEQKSNKFCGTVWVDAYEPQLVVPSQLSTLVPEWGSRNCAGIFALWDPPTALAEAATVAGLTTAVTVEAQTTTAAVPAVTPTRAAPQTTSVRPTESAASGSEVAAPSSQRSSSANSVAAAESSGTGIGADPVVSSTDPRTLVSIGGQVYTVTTQSGGSTVLANGQATLTVETGSSTATVSGEVVSLSATDSLVSANGATASTASAGTGGSYVISSASLSITQTLQPSGVSVFANAYTTITRSGSDVVTEGQTIGAGLSSSTTTGDDSSANPTAAIHSVGQTETTTVSVASQRTMNLESATITLSPGGPAVTANSRTYSEATDGAIVAAFGSQTTTIPAPTAPSSIIILGSTFFTATHDASGAEVLENASTSISLSAGGPAVLVGSETVSAGPSGHAVVVSGFQASTVITPTVAATGAQASTVDAASSPLRKPASAASSSTTATSPSSTRASSAGQRPTAALLLVVGMALALLLSALMTAV
ncbi:hypothetical protein B0A54_16068 [Friedmanniomyces endolithicus]|uniref:Uncharacterized protein n=1 Tax=Friedmanniomyces endolithicus TaxID=329885 RepID=A0A4U0U154_9PEZI|nr:hypothetical protein B0A54_16068 [Friedmanniomyces endolithicus]